MADQTTLQVDKIIITRQNPIDETERIPEQLDYGQLAIDIKGNLYTGDKNNNVVSAGGSGGGREWSEIDNQTAAEPPNPREADQLNGYKATDIIKEAVKQASEIDILLPTEPDSPRQADQLGGYDAESLIEKAVQSATLIDELTTPEPESIKDADTLNGLASDEIIENNGINLYTHSKVGTVHNFSGSGINGRAKMTANVETGDTFTVNGIPVVAYMGTNDAVENMAGEEWNNKWITFVFEENTLNFKSGGGLSAADKALLIPKNIREGITIAGVTGALTWKDLLPEKLVVVRNGKSAEPDIFGDWIHMGIGATSYGEDYITTGQGSNRSAERSSLQIDCSLWSRIEFDAKLTYQGNGSVKFGITTDLTVDTSLENRFDKYVQAAGVGNRTTYAIELPASGKYYVKIAGGWATANVYNITLIKRA